MMLSDPDETAETILEAARGAFMGLPPSPVERPARRRRSGDRLRVGYLSSGFQSTPSYYFTYPFLTNHDRSKVEVFLYSHRPASDAAASTGELGEHYTQIDFHDRSTLDLVFAAHDLDVLVHMAGHFAYNGLELLCGRIAPVQICYPNFPSTTGCPGVDYVMSDQWTSPEGTEAEYSERLYRIPTGSLAFAVPKSDPAAAALPMLTAPGPTFGVFQRLAKFNAPFCDALAAVLARVPAARLVIHSGDGALDDPDSATSRLLKRRFEARGIDPVRVWTQGAASIPRSPGVCKRGGRVPGYFPLWRPDHHVRIPMDGRSRRSAENGHAREPSVRRHSHARRLPRVDCAHTRAIRRDCRAARS